ncbi:CGNR zinc finger domain-containing protein [Streptomyces sp. NRRL S-920]|uniref:CGNR zinc finger domain-containing protein n=1 Tax=Streptomyces sp. NRRL S-920 TaxID=1463921 RepID=UPI0004CB040D|nr:CGNR zinc finger domain-containing protein [Streptomyces sp. NRRL S-920]
MALGMAPAPYELRFDSGRSCLDLVATRHPVERLDSVARLRAWLVGAGLVPAGASWPGVGPPWLTAFLELRSSIEQLVLGEIEGAPADSALERVNALAAPAPPAPCAVRAADGTLTRALRAAPECAALVACVARDAVDLLTDPAARALLRQCAGDNCPIVYLDTSRGHRRRWCSSEVCGNRERVARHRRRAALARP